MTIKITLRVVAVILLIMGILLFAVADLHAFKPVFFSFLLAVGSIFVWSLSDEKKERKQ